MPPKEKSVQAPSPSATPVEEEVEELGPATNPYENTISSPPGALPPGAHDNL